jgi:hypothetical protein
MNNEDSHHISMRKTSLMIDEKNQLFSRDRAISHTFGLKLDPMNQFKQEPRRVIEEPHKDIS